MAELVSDLHTRFGSLIAPTWGSVREYLMSQLDDTGLQFDVKDRLCCDAYGAYADDCRVGLFLN